MEVKIGFLNFFVGEWLEKVVYVEKIKDCMFFVIYGDNCIKFIFFNGIIIVSIVLEFCSN